MSKLSVFLLLALVSVSSIQATPNNQLLQYTMKAIAKDLPLVVDPTKKPVGEASDNVVLTAIIRTRTMSALFQTCIDRREGELAPGKLAETTDPLENKALSEQYVNLLGRAQAQLAAVEKLYFVELGKDVAVRDFAPAARELKTLEAVIGESHSMFKPPKP